MDKTSRKRVIVFGNPGTEKTPFVNTLIGGKDLCNEIVIDSSRYTIYDTPGLIADNQYDLDRNMKQIDELLSKNEESILIYMLGIDDGCINADDIIGLKTLQANYKFEPSSLLIVVNNYDAKRDEMLQKDLFNIFNEFVTIDTGKDAVFFLSKMSFNQQSLWDAIKKRGSSIPVRDSMFSSKLDDIIELRKYVYQVSEKFGIKVKASKSKHEQKYVLKTAMIPMLITTKNDVINLVFCLGIPSNSIRSSKQCRIEYFQDEFRFIERVLSTEHERLFLIISTRVEHFVVPLICRHCCVERIFLFYSSIDKLVRLRSWILDGKFYQQKVRILLDDNQILLNTIENLTNKRTQRYDPIVISAMLHLSTMNCINILNTVVLKQKCTKGNSLYNELILIYHSQHSNLVFNETQLIPHEEFCYEYEYEFINAVQTEHNKQIFIILSGDPLPKSIEKILDLKQIQEIYQFQTKYSIKSERFQTRIFHNGDELSTQLSKDILAVRFQNISLCHVDIFPKIDDYIHVNIVRQLTKQHIQLLVYSFFFDILPQVPSLEIKPNYCNLLDTIHDDSDTLLEHLDFCQSLLRFHQRDNLHDLCVLQKPLVHIQTQIQQSSKSSNISTVYVAKVLSNDVYQELKQNCGKLISLGIVLVATKSIEDARSIARIAAENELLSVLFEIEITRETQLLEIDSNRFLFRLVSVFRLDSVVNGFDRVKYAKLRCAQSEFESIKKHLRIEINIPLSWLTFGNFISAFDCFDRAVKYYRYLISEYSYCKENYLSALYNSLGLVMTMMGRENEAIKSFDLALKYNAYPDKKEPQVCESFEIASIDFARVPITNSILYGSMADVHLEKDEYCDALKFYRKAFEQTDNPQYLVYYQTKIKKLLN